MSKPQVNKKKSAGKATFVVDASIPVKDKLIVAEQLEKFFQENIKVKAVGGVKGKLGENVKISRVEGIITIEVENDATAKRQLKYLTRRYLKKQTLSNYLRVIAPKKDSYLIKYFASQEADEEGEDVE